MLAAIMLVYVLMVLTFGSLLDPFILLFALPLAAIGAFPALLITGRTLSISAMIGLLMLVGIVVTNAIVLLDMVKQREKQGMSTREALLEGGRIRVRPILMTAMATILATLPLALMPIAWLLHRGGTGHGGDRWAAQFDPPDAAGHPSALQPRQRHEAPARGAAECRG